MEKTRKIFCNTCKLETNHVLIKSHERYLSSEQGEHFELSEWADYPEALLSENHNTIYLYQFWVCRGCDTATLQESSSLKMLVNETTKQAFWVYTFHPKRATDHFFIKNFIDMPPGLWVIYYELIQSFNAELLILTSIGLRALLEGICVDKGITDKDARGLKGKLTELDKRQHLPSGIVKNLDSFKFIGDNAAHKLEAPTIQNLKLAIEVMEELLSFLYSLNTKASILFKRLNN